ncbi:2-oxoadipate dioxygenase/decarboxylase family protein [Bradyrhizobium japonicum]|uniref:2-oxoadipate dioxygenase/decarboxylase family protein n=1 Tax=Bradyrhizobium japonicum TaxID=375 RepID=UPI000B1D838F
MNGPHRLEQSEEADGFSVERHDAVRLGAAQELFDIRRVFAVTGTLPVGLL